MPSESLRVQIPHAGVDEVSAILDAPDDDPGGPVVLLAHGAGVGMTSGFLETIGRGLAAAGFPTLRFHYAYAERMARGEGRRPPDRRPVLEAVHEAALAALQARYPERAPVLAGKSMGGRMSSYLAAAGVDCRALVFYGYPLHPAGKPERLRVEHFPTLAQPALFLQGTRDDLGSRDEISGYALSPAIRVTFLEDGDHSFKPRVRSGRTLEANLAEAVDGMDAFLRGLR